MLKRVSFLWKKFRGKFVIGTKNIDQINLTINSRRKK